MTEAQRSPRVAWQARIRENQLAELRELRKRLPGGLTLADVLEAALTAGIAKLRAKVEKPKP